MINVRYDTLLQWQVHCSLFKVHVHMLTHMLLNGENIVAEQKQKVFRLVILMDATAAI